MKSNLTTKVKEWKNTMEKSEPSHIVQVFRLPCKWMRPLRDVFVACWNKEKVRQNIDSDVGTLQLKDRPFCRGEKEDAPDCWEGLKQSCIDNCIHYAKFKKADKFNRLRGYCTKQCKNFELFKRDVKYERTKMIDFEPIIIKQKYKKSRQGILELIL